MDLSNPDLRRAVLALASSRDFLKVLAAIQTDSDDLAMRMKAPPADSPAVSEQAWWRAGNAAYAQQMAMIVDAARAAEARAQAKPRTPPSDEL